MCSRWLASCGGLGIPDTMLMSDGSCSWQVGRCAPGMMDVHMCDPEGWVATRRERQCSLVLASSHRSRARAALDGSRLNRTSAGPGSGPTHLPPSQCDWGGLPPAPCTPQQRCGRGATQPTAATGGAFATGGSLTSTPRVDRSLRRRTPGGTRSSRLARRCAASALPATSHELPSTSRSGAYHAVHASTITRHCFVYVASY